MIPLLAVLFVGQLQFPYETRVVVNIENDMVYYARFYQNRLISVDSVVSFADYLAARARARNEALLHAELRREMAGQGGYANQGLIGTIVIPMPEGGFSDFMGETSTLDVGGHVKVTLGGSQTFVLPDPSGQPQSWVPELKMEQEMAINLDGEVGDRMRVFIDHNSTRINETENKIRVTYLGHEDEILQEIEGGDTQLSIPATNYTGDIPAHEGLFGIKSTAKLGPLDIVAIASQEQKQGQEIEIEGSVSAVSDTVSDRAYAKRQFFWIAAGAQDSIVYLQVYVDDNNGLNNSSGITYYGKSILDVNDDNVSDDTAQDVTGYYTRLSEGDDYQFVPGANILQLTRDLLVNQDALGVYYIKMSGGMLDTVGVLPDSADTTIHLKLICPRVQDTASVAWKYYELKNYYQIVSAGSRLDSLRIFYQPSGSNPVDRDPSSSQTFLQIMGLDQNGDNLVDENRGYGFDQARGLLIFPDPLPFVSPDLPEPDSEIYTNPNYMMGSGKYFLLLKTIESRPEFQLQAGVTADQITVFVNDLEVDESYYHFDEGEGMLTFIRPILPTDRVRIKYEYSPFASMASRSLVGLRGSTKLLGEGTLGSSFFYRSESYQTSASDHIQLREEPYSRMVVEGDFSLPQNIPLLTRIVDAMPVVETEVESKASINFEGAYSFSNANAAGKVYLDDFESSTVGEDISVNRTQWSPCAKPVTKDTGDFALSRLVWFNPTGDDRLQANDVFTDAPDPEENIDVLKIVFKPGDTLDFAGLTQFIYGKDFDECANLEVIINGSQGTMHVDVAQDIGEDQLRRDHQGALSGYGVLDDEDRDNNSIWNENTEDTGLDETYGADSLEVPGDAGNDDFDFDVMDRINGTEGNGIWDTEDLDRNGQANNSNWYYAYHVTLDDTTNRITTGLQDGWCMYRIPIKDTLVRDTVFGNPDWHNIRYVRIWFDGLAQTETLTLYKLSITGSRWKNSGIRAGATNPVVDSSEKFTLTPVNTKTHTYYQSPYPLDRDPLTGELDTEGGLEIRLDSIRTDHSCVAYRRTVENEDYRAYDTLTFYLRALHSTPRISLRIGSDSTNYYEYAAEYESGTLGYNNYRLFRVAVSRFLDLKRQTGGQGTLTEGDYTVVGNPSLAVNRYFELSITNEMATPLTDTLWFNDIRLTSPRAEVGRTIRANGSLNLADLSSVRFAFSESNGRFRRLSEANAIASQGSGYDFSVNPDVSLHKFLPASWGFNIPLNMGYARTRHNPRFSYVSSDLEVEGPDAELENNTSLSKSYSVSLTKSNSRNWLLRQLLDRTTLGNDRSESYSRSAQDSSMSVTGSWRGNYRLDPKVSIRLLHQTINLLPQSLTAGAILSEQRSKSYYRSRPDTSFSLQFQQRRRSLTPNVAVTYSPHAILTGNYSFGQTRDSLTEGRRFGEEVSRNQSFSASAQPRLPLVRPLSLTYNAHYTEDHRFEIRQDQNYRNVNNSSGYSIDAPVDVKAVVRFFTRMRDETKDSLLVPGSPVWIVKQVERFIDNLSNPVFKYSNTHSSAYAGALVRPDLRYQWGLVDSMAPEDFTPNSIPSRTAGEQFSVNSRYNMRVFDVSAQYAQGINRVRLNSGSENRIVTRSYPDANIRIPRLDMIPLFKRLTHSASLNSRVNTSNEARYTVQGDSITKDSDSRTLSLTPVVGWQATWRKGITSGLDINYTETRSRLYAYPDTVPSLTLNRGGSLTLGYTFSAPGGLKIPLLRGIRFTSNLTTSLQLNYNRATSYEGTMDVPRTDGTTVGASMNATYSLSNSITAGGALDYAQSHETNSNQDTRRVGLNAWVNINF